MITVVNVIPPALSGETHQDSEPNIAVNPADPRQIAITAFTPDPMGGPNAPLFISSDGGTTWSLNSIVPQVTGIFDITTRFAGRNGNLYAGTLPEIVAPANPRLNVDRTGAFASPTTMTVLDNRVGSGLDQPFTTAATVLGGAGAGTDRVYVGVNDFNAAGGRTATVEQSLDAGAALPSFSPSRLETRSTLGQDGPQIRPAIHPDGTIYAAFSRWIASSGSFPANTLVITNAEAIVTRDDNWGTGPNPFTALTDPSDGLAGRRVATGLSFPFNRTATDGQERWGGDLAIAVDPNNSATVYLAYTTRDAGTYTLHVRRSTNRGVDWSPDLKTVATAKNPALAINSQGKVGLAYQRLTGTGATQRWETHFEVTVNAFATSSDSVLATVPAGAPANVFSPYLGDYIGMMAVGKDFYGTFCANNTPDMANFPSGVTFLRNHDFGTHQLFANDGTTVVPISIDPFFFRVTDTPVSSDLYVRDWTDTTASHDTGLEPSSNPWFFVNPDVWNRRSNAPGAFTANDQPVNEDPQMAPAGSNFAFCRVNRNATGTAENATAHFLYSEFGTGSNFQDANVTPDPAINFAAADAETTMAAGYEWLLPPTTSTHLCVAVEITSPNDPLKLPSLIGRAPGWPTTDLIVINDNNKAQRNMGVHAMMAGMNPVTFYALAHNASTALRDMALLFETTDRGLPLLKGTRLEIVDGVKERQQQPFQQHGQVVLGQMRPADNVWVGIALPPLAGKPGDLLPLTVRELVDGVAVNGFTIAARPARPEEVCRESFELHAASFLRAAESFHLERARVEGAFALDLVRKGRISPATCLSALKGRLQEITAAIKELLGLQLAPDAFGLAQATDDLARAIAGGGAPAVLTAHANLVQKMDAYVTMLQKAQGDEADIMQMVVWQSALFQGLRQKHQLPVADAVIAASDEFIAQYQARKATNKEYPGLLSGLLGAFKSAADALKLSLDAELAEVDHALGGPPATLEKAHRSVLLRLDGAAS
jgi:hypothetical protein